jgi:hypothetical protein
MSMMRMFLPYTNDKTNAMTTFSNVFRTSSCIRDIHIESIKTLIIFKTAHGWL